MFCKKKKKYIPEWIQLKKIKSLFSGALTLIPEYHLKKIANIEMN